jgi:primary-amine oxidase
MTTNDGNILTIPDAVCLHEEDCGVLWKHTGTTLHSLLFLLFCLINVHDQYFQLLIDICNCYFFVIMNEFSDWRSGKCEVRRGRRLIISFFATVANYDYGFNWMFYLDGTIEVSISFEQNKTKNQKMK